MRQTSLRLYSYHRNSAGERVRIALNLKGLAFDYVSAPSLGEAYRGINPQGLLPALETGGRVIAQSGAILEFLEETFPEPPLLPADPLLRGEARAFAHLIASEMHALTVQRVRKQLGSLGVADENVARWCRHWMEEGLGALETTLARRAEATPYCFGERPGWADLHLVPQLRNARRFGCDLAAYPSLTYVEAHCVGLDAFRRARPEHQPDAPNDAVASMQSSLPENAR